MAGRPPSNRPASARPAPAPSDPPARRTTRTRPPTSRSAATTGGVGSAPTGNALVHLPSAMPSDSEPKLDERSTDVDEWGRSEHMRELARRLYDPIYRTWFRVEWEGLEKIPTDGGALLVANHAGAIPSRRAGDHARHRDRARPAGLRPGRPPLPDDAGRRHAVVAARRRARPSRQRLPPAARAEPARARVPRGHARARRKTLRRALPAAAVRPRRLRRDRDAGRRAGRSRSRWSAPRSRCRSCSGSPSLAKALGLPYVPITANMLALGPARARRLLPGEVQAPGARPGALRRASRTRSATRAAGSWTSPRHIREQIQDALYDMLRDRAVGLVRLMAADGPERGPRHRARHASGAAGSRRRSRPTRTSRSSSGSTPTEPTVELERTEYVRGRRELLDPGPHREGDPGRHDRPHVPRRRLRRRCRRRAMHEINVIGTMNLFAAASAAGLAPCATWS